MDHSKADPAFPNRGTALTGMLTTDQGSGCLTRRAWALMQPLFRRPLPLYRAVPALPQPGFFPYQTTPLDTR